MSASSKYTKTAALLIYRRLVDTCNTKTANEAEPSVNDILANMLAESQARTDTEEPFWGGPAEPSEEDPIYGHGKGLKRKAIKKVAQHFFKAITKSAEPYSNLAHNPQLRGLQQQQYNKPTLPATTPQRQGWASSDFSKLKAPPQGPKPRTLAGFDEGGPDAASPKPKPLAKAPAPIKPVTVARR